MSYRREATPSIARTPPSRSRLLVFALLTLLTLHASFLAACSDRDHTCDEYVWWAFTEQGMAFEPPGYITEGPVLWMGFFEKDGRLYLYRTGGLWGVQWDEVLSDGTLGRTEGHFFGGIVTGGFHLDAAPDGRIRSFTDREMLLLDSEGAVEEVPLVADSTAIQEGFWIEQYWRVDDQLYGIWAHRRIEPLPKVSTAGLCVIEADGLVTPRGAPFYRHEEGIDPGSGLAHLSGSDIVQGGWDPARQLFQVSIHLHISDLIWELDRNGEVLAEWSHEDLDPVERYHWRRISIPPTAVVRTLTPYPLGDEVWAAVLHDFGSSSWYLFNEPDSDIAEIPLLDDPPSPPDRYLWFVTQHMTSDGTLWIAAAIGDDLIIRRWDPTEGTLTPETRSPGYFRHCDAKTSGLL